jgi:hypothetical protein
MAQRFAARAAAWGMSAALGLPLAVAQAAPVPEAAVLSRAPLRMDPAWRAQVLHEPGTYVKAVNAQTDGRPGAVRDARALLGKGGTRLVSQTAGDARIVVDLGRLASGFVEIGVRDAKGGPIRVAYAEGREELGKWGDASSDPEDFFYRGKTLAPEDDPDGRADVYDAPRGRTVLKSPGLRGSQRFVAISLDGPGSVTVDFVRVRQTNYIDSYEGHFLSNDVALNRAWYGSAYALELSTVRDMRKPTPGPWMIIDGPKRDRVAYIADLALVAFGAYGQSSAYHPIVRDTLNLFACRQSADGSMPAVGVIGQPCPLGDPGPTVGPPPGYLPGEAALARLDGFTASWVGALADYVLYSGDREFAKPLLPTARRVVALLDSHADARGLFVTGNYGGQMGFNWHTPDKAAGTGAWDNETYYSALRGLAELERSVGDGAAAADALDRRADKLRDTILAAFWDPKVGAMRLNLEDPKADHTADANAFALALGMLGPDHAKQAMSFLSGPLARPYGTANSEYPDNPYMSQYISPYVMAVETIGRFRYGDGQGALDLIRKAWPYMMDKGAGVPWEEISVDGRFIVGRPGLAEGSHVDLAHAWSTAAPALSMFVLGVHPATAGFERWTIAPQPVDLRWAQGATPTPKGPINVLWRRGDGDRSFVLTIEAPKSTSGAVVVPLLGKDRDIAMDGRLVWTAGAAAAGIKATKLGDAVVFDSVSGARTFAWGSDPKPREKESNDR